jgi:hypothetical protein
MLDLYPDPHKINADPKHCPGEAASVESMSPRKLLLRNHYHDLILYPSQPCNDLWNGYSSELLSLWWLTDEKIEGKKPLILSLYVSYWSDLDRFPRGHWPRWNCFNGVSDPAETVSAWSLTPLKPFLRGHWPRRGVLYMWLIHVVNKTVNVL